MAMARRIDKWSSTILVWVYSISEDVKGDILSSDLETLAYLCKSDIFSKILITIYETRGKNMPCTTDHEELANIFLKDFYPKSHNEYNIDLKNDEDLVIFWSLLMYTACIKLKISSIISRNTMYINDSEKEKSLARFFSLMMEVDRLSEMKRQDVIEAILETLGHKAVSTRSCSSPVSTPSGLKEFFDSPILRIYKKENELKRYKDLLKDEQEEKLELLEKVQKLEKTVKKMETELNDKSKELKQVKIDFNQLLWKSPDQVAFPNNEKRLIREIETLKNEISDANKETDLILEERNKFQSQIAEAKAFIITLEAALEESSQKLNEFEENCRHLSNKVESYEYRIKEQNQLIEEFKDSESKLNEREMHYIPVSNFEENLGKTVIDLQLKEKEDKINELAVKVSSLQEEYEITVKQKDVQLSQLLETQCSLNNNLQSKVDEIENLNKQLKASLNDFAFIKDENANLQSKINDQNASIDKLNTEIKKFNEKVQCNESHLLELQDRNKTLESENFELISNIKDQDAQISQLLATQCDLNNNLQSKVDEIENLNKQLETSLNDFAFIKDENANLQSRIKDQNASIDKLNKEIKEFNEKVQCNERHLIELKDRNQTLETENCELISNVKDKDVQLSQLLETQCDLNNNLQSKVAEIENLNKQLKASQNDFAFIKDENANLQSKINDQNASIDKLNTEIKKINEKVQCNERHLLELQDRNKTLETENCELISNVKDQDVQIRMLLATQCDLNNNLQSKVDEIENLNKQLKASLNDFAFIKDENANLQSKINYQDESIDNLNIEIQKFNQKVQRNECHLIELQDRNKMLETENCELISNVNDKDVQLSQLLETQCSLNNNLQSKVDEIENLNKQLKASLNDFAFIKDENANLQSKINDQNASIDKLNTEIKKFNEKVQCNESHLLELQDRNKTLESENFELISNIKDQDAQISQLLATQCDLNNNLQSKVDEIENLNKQLETSLNDFAFIKDENANLQSRIKDQNASIDKLNKEIKEFNEKVQCNERHLIELKDRNQTLETENCELISNVKDKDVQISQLLATQCDINNNLQSKVDEIENLNERLRTSMNDIEFTRNENANLQSKINDCDTCIDQLKIEIQKLNANVQCNDWQLIELQHINKTLETEKCELISNIKDQKKHMKDLEYTKSELSNEIACKISKIEIMTQNLEEKNELLKTLNKEFDQVKDKHDHLLSINSEFELTIAQSSKQIEGLKEEVQSLQDQLQKSEAENFTLDCERSKLSSTIEQQIIQIRDLEVTEIELSNDVELKISEIELLTKKCEEKDELLTTLNNELELVKDKHGDLLSKHNMHEYTILQLNNEIESLKEEVQSGKDRLEELQAINVTLESERSELMLNVENQVKQISDLELIKVRLSDELQFKIDEIESISEELEKQSEQLRIVKNNFERIIKENDHLLATTNEKEEITAVLNKEIATLKEVVQASKNQVEDLRTRNMILENDYSELHGAVEKKSKQISDLELDKIELSKELEIAQNQIKSLNITIDLIQKENETLSLKNIEKDNSIGQLNAVIEQLKEEVRLSECHVEELKGKNAILESGNSDLMIKVQHEITTLKSENAQTIQDIQKKELHIAELKEECSFLKKNNEELLQAHDPNLKQAYEKLLDDFHRLNDANDSLKTDHSKLIESHNNVRSEFEAKLKKLKQQMIDHSTHEITQKEEKFKLKMKPLQETVRSSQDKISELSSRLWDTSDKLLITKNENDELKKKNAELEKSLATIHREQSLLKQRAQQLGNSTPDLRVQMEDTFTVTRRRSIRTVPSGMGIKLLPSGKVFPSEDEVDEQCFSSKYLEDLKAGRCTVSTDTDRLSTLQYRNSLCPPHLKSSYPAETQFLNMDGIHEDDIKGKCEEEEDTRSLLSERQRRRDRSQTSYKRPGPPTPSKNSSRPFSQSVELKSVSTPRSALREVNDIHKKPATPSRLFNIFSRQKDENTPTASNNARRLSFFRRRKE